MSAASRTSRPIQLFSKCVVYSNQVELEPLYEKWSSADPVFKSISKRYTGVRMLRQEPTENIISFICSSNNNITR